MIGGASRVVVDGLTCPERPDDLDGLLEHGQADVGRRPAVAQDMFVERLAGADAEEEPAIGEQRRRGCSLSQDRRVDAGDRAGDSNADLESLGGVGDGAEG